MVSAECEHDYCSVPGLVEREVSIRPFRLQRQNLFGGGDGDVAITSFYNQPGEGVQASVLLSRGWGWE